MISDTLSDATFIIMRNDLDRPVVGPFASEADLGAWIEADEKEFGPAYEQTVWQMVTPGDATEQSRQLAARNRRASHE